MHTLLSELSKHFNFAGVPDLPLLGSQSHVDTQMHQLTVFEDNTGCLELANKHDQFHPRTNILVSNGIIFVTQSKMVVLWSKRLTQACSSQIL
jgi:hypothetical protein